MSKKRSREVTVASPARHIDRRMEGGGEVVRVDAVFHVPTVHPSGPGPWNGEADKISWTDEPTGYGCIIRRSPRGGHLEGFVSVPPGHPLFGRRTGSIGEHIAGVHGGIAYAAACQKSEPEPVSICHPSGREVRRAPSRSSRRNVYENDVAKADDEAWWLGFSCNQIGDVIPDADHVRLQDLRLLAGVVVPVYRTEAYVYRECVRLAVQLKAIGERRDPREVDPGPSASRYDPYRPKG